MSIVLPGLGLKRCYLGTKDLAPPPAFPALPEGLMIRTFKAPDLQSLGPQAMDPAMSEHRLACGDRPWGLWRGRELLAYGWSTTRPTSILALSMLIPGEQEAYLYGFYTPPKHRGNGYYPLLLRHICAHLGEEGTTRAWIAVFTNNASSWKGVLKAGFRKTSTHMALNERLSWTLPEGEEPQPTLRPRLRGLHLGLRMPLRAAPMRARRR